jgi:type I site-specific restriction-modification system R (restriction) subunit|tara:strand:- start:77 stop:298 length:222 start_codon:yes stop_codon:yes gene_type:complete
MIYNLRVAGEYVGYAETEEAVMELFDEYVETNNIKNAFADVSIEYDNVYEDYEDCEERHWKNLTTHNERFTDG